MSLNRKHFDRIAAAAKANTYPATGDLSPAFLHELATILGEANGSFQEEVFLEACKPRTLKTKGVANGTTKEINPAS